jgi:hypothetical protein
VSNISSYAETAAAVELGNTDVECFNLNKRHQSPQGFDTGDGSTVEIHIEARCRTRSQYFENGFKTSSVRSECLRWMGLGLSDSNSRSG